MITKRVADLFQFIEFLHSNTETFKAYDVVMGEMDALENEQRKLNPKKNYKDKIRYDAINAEVAAKINAIDRGVVQPIRAEVKKYNIYNLETPGGARLEEDIVSDLLALKKNVNVNNVNDVPQILDSIKKYIEFRTKTNDAYFQSFFFSSLDETLQDLFVFFEGGTGSEFKAFEVFKKISTAECEQPTCGLKSDPDNNDEMVGFIFRELQKDNWFVGSERDFKAIFKPEELPIGWQPIEYTNESKDNKPNLSALGTLIKELAPEVGYITFENKYFTYKGKKFDIPNNNRDSTKVKQKLKGIKTKYKRQ